MIVELRQYTLHPGRRDELIELFEREFVEPQEALGVRVLGTFRDIDDPDKFVWLRAFPDPATRLACLTGFYGGPVWRRHRDASNATMVDSDDVLLLEHVTGDLSTAERSGPSRVLAVVRILRTDVEPDLDSVPRLLGAPVVVLRTSGLANDFPALPVREDRAVVWLARFTDADAARVARKAFEEADPTVQVLELEPTARSAYR